MRSVSSRCPDVNAQTERSHTRGYSIADVSRETNQRLRIDSSESIAKATEANTKAIADPILEMRVGFAELKGQVYC